MKIIFAGTPKFALLPFAALLQKHEVVAVFTQPDRKAGRGKKLSAPPVKILAQQNQVPVFQPLTLQDQQRTIKKLEADVIVVVAYGMLLPSAILDIPPLGCINIHASILPRWRGAAPIQRAIEAGDSQTGISIMQMEPGLDTGAVYQTLTTAIESQDTTASLHDKLAVLGAQGIISTLDSLEKTASLVATPQNDELATYAKKISKQEAQIDWSMSAKQIHNQIRAFNPWPICQTRYRQTRIRLWQASVNENKANQISPAPAGSIVSIDKQGITVACGRGTLRLEVLQRDGGKPLFAEKFYHGYHFEVGGCFDS